MTFDDKLMKIGHYTKHLQMLPYVGDNQTITCNLNSRPYAPKTYFRLHITIRSKSFWKSNSLQPDIVIEHKTTQRKYIIDTKWKRPGFSASVEDLRQVYAYARFWKAEHVMLLYPGDSKNNKEDVFETRDLVPFLDEDFSHKGYLRFAKVVKDGKVCEGFAERVLEGFIEIDELS